MIIKRLLFLFVLFFIAFSPKAQRSKQIPVDETVRPDDIYKPERSISIGDSIFILLPNCKNAGALFYPKDVKIKSKSEPLVIFEKPAPFLRVHGNILYNFSYQSSVDTPFAQNGLMQHLVQTSFNFVVKDKYPVRVTLRNRSSNSPYFRNSTDVNIEFTRRQLLDNIKGDFKNKAAHLVNTDALTKAEQQYHSRELQKQQLQTWVNSPARAQELIEEKERTLRGDKNALTVNPQQLTGKTNILEASGYENGDFLTSAKENKNFHQFNRNSIQKMIPEDSALVEKYDVKKNKLLSDSGAIGKLKDRQESDSGMVGKFNTKKDKLETDSSVIGKLNKKKKELLLLEDSLKKEEAQIKSLRKKVQDSVNIMKREVNGVTTSSGLYEFMKKNGIAKSELTKAQRILLSINKIGIGRSLIDYSELTVKNISLSGINVELNPLPFYFAFAAGKVNYRFRDFIVKGKEQVPDQSLYVLRAGVGQKEKNNLIVTFYNGKKSVLNYPTFNAASSVQKVLGISVEGRLAMNQNNYIIAEAAKSSYNSNSNVRPANSELVGKAFNLKVHSNTAYSIKLFSLFPQTRTRLIAFYKKIGENFQSFNLNPMNVNQDAWMVRLSQDIWKRRLTLDGSIRKNGFESPATAPSYSTKTVFKSLQATLRIPKYPFVSLGYYPSSQLSVSNNNVIVENQYNTLNIISGYSYRVKKLSMSTNAVYTKFYNNSNDSGFIYFNASNYTVSQSIFFSKITLESSLGVTNQVDMHLFSLEQALTYQFNSYFSLTGGLKWNRLNRDENLLGYKAGMNISIKKLGTIQMNYDKTFLPGYNKTLKPVDIGRMSFIREF